MVLICTSWFCCHVSSVPSLSAWSQLRRVISLRFFGCKSRARLSLRENWLPNGIKMRITITGHFCSNETRQNKHWILPAGHGEPIELPPEQYRPCGHEPVGAVSPPRQKKPASQSEQSDVASRLYAAEYVPEGHGVIVIGDVPAGHA